MLVIEQPVDDILQMLQREKGKDGKLGLDDLRLVGQIYSIRVGKGVHVLLHASKTKFAVKRLYDLMHEQSDFTVNTALEGKLAFFLAEAAKREGQGQADLLYNITTFVKNGKSIKGKRYVEDLSPQAQAVALDKIRLLLNKEPTGQKTVARAPKAVAGAE